MQISLVVTVLNEATTIDLLLAGISQQTTPPREIIVVDGGSTDQTLNILKAWKKSPTIGKKLKIFRKKGNRSVGRNFGISQAKHSWIAITDAGCVPLNDWLAQLAIAQQQSQAKVIAGYYFGLPNSSFEQAVVPYVLVMPDKVDPENFLPATRSMMIHRSVRKKLGGFDEKLKYNEDYAFAKKVEQNKIKIAFTDKALVGWLPRTNLKSFYQMIYRFAYGDLQAGILRPKVVLIFLRYFIFLALLSWSSFTGTLANGASFFLAIIMIYFIWAVMKNRKYLDTGRLWLPILQVTSDLAVMAGSFNGWLAKKKK